MKKLRVTVEGKPYEVLVEILDDGASNHSRAPAPAPAAATVSSASVSSDSVVPVTAARTAAPAGAGDVPSPLAGKIVTIDVKPGDQVNEGAQVVTIEAMKMNTYIFAPKAGRVLDILVKPGDGVEEGAVLLRIA